MVVEKVGYFIGIGYSGVFGVKIRRFCSPRFVSTCKTVYSFPSLFRIISVFIENVLEVMLFHVFDCIVVECPDLDIGGT